MIYRLVVPTTFEDMTELRVLEWHCSPGARVESGAMLVELETHKAIVEVRADQPGVLRRRLCEEGAWCALGASLALLSDDADEPLSPTEDALGTWSARFAIA